MKKAKKDIKTKELFFSKSMDFLEVHIPLQRGQSPNTSASYRKSLTSFRKFAFEVKNISITKFCFADCTYDFVLDYSSYMQNVQHLKASTINSRLAALKAYLKYAAAMDISLEQIYLTVNKVPFLTVPVLRRPTISQDSMKAMLEAPTQVTTSISLRDQTFLVTLFDTAVRIGELVKISMADLYLDISEPYIVIHGKGNKERQVGVSDDTVDFLRKYIETTHSEDESSDTPLFYVRYKGEIHHMTERNGERIVKKYAEMLREAGVDLPETVYPHMFRRTRATGMYQDDVDIEMVARLLGHAQLETTKKYAYNSTKQLRSAMERGGRPAINEPEEALYEGADKEAAFARKFGIR